MFARLEAAWSRPVLRDHADQTPGTVLGAPQSFLQTLLAVVSPPL